jgi:hypothetical protein
MTLNTYNVYGGEPKHATSTMAATRKHKKLNFRKNTSITQKVLNYMMEHFYV